MGCDIHLFIEYKLGDGPWQADSHHVTDEDDYLQDVYAAGRNYELFGALAGVRCEGPDPKGLPDDVSEIIKAESDKWDSDGHSHSYSSLEEFKDALKKCDLYRMKGVEPYAFSGDHDANLSWANIIAYCKAQIRQFKTDLAVEKHLLGQNINTDVQCRLVYFFDN